MGELKVGQNTKIANDVVFERMELGDVVIGSGCTIRSNNVIYGGTKIGDGTKTGHFVLIREKTVIGKNCLIGSGTILDGDVKIGDNVRIQSMVYIPPKCIIEDDVFIGPRAVLTNDKYPPQPNLQGVTIKKGASIGANSTLLPGVVVGENALVGAGAVVTKNVPPNSVVVGNPARVIKKRSELRK
ncbi:MAG: acyltransferase [Candidatus Anstonellales archaeon]